MNTRIAEFRFYEELNDFLPREKRKKSFPHAFVPKTSIKDIIESLGVPHTEVDLILVNSKSVGFRYQPKDQDHISVYPVFESLDITDVTRLRPKPLRISKFVLDVHLGKLARYLRLLGFDTLYQTDYSDQQIAEIATNENRIVLTRDVGLLKNKKITRGYWLRNTAPKEQAKEIIHRFDLQKNFKPFTRCLECNGKITRIKKSAVIKKIPEDTQAYFQDFFQCKECQRIYWHGSHFDKLEKVVKSLS